MTIREAINVLIDATDKDTPFIIECRKDTFDNIDTEWGQAEISRIVNCVWGSVAEVKEPNQGRKEQNNECK